MDMNLIVRQAEDVVKSLKKDRENKIGLKMTQLRKLLAAINSINNRLLIWESERPNETILAQDIVNEIKYLEVKLVYQIGRENPKEGYMKQFEDKAQLRAKIAGVGNSVDKYKEFAKFMEAIVAFHKFHGGKD